MEQKRLHPPERGILAGNTSRHGNAGPGIRPQPDETIDHGDAGNEIRSPGRRLQRDGAAKPVPDEQHPFEANRLAKKQNVFRKIADAATTQRGAAGAMTAQID